MLIKKLTSSICSLFALRERLRLEETSHFEVITRFFSTKANIEERPSDNITKESSRIKEDETALEVELCCVCLRRLKEHNQENSQEMRILTCRHEFHKACVDKWFTECRKTCPVCRFSVEEEEKTQKSEVTEEMVIWFSSFHVAGYI